ncbi:MAG TPA: formate/nitrite transporter family protein [Blastocatellia bacterium]|nr:formate/nitrite transporter family protein [Blastocatellia bacterium]
MAEQLPEEEKKEGQEQSSESSSETTTGTRLTATEIYENVRVAAEAELRRPPRALLWSALAAGLTIGFSFLAGAYLSSLVPEPFKHAANSIGYPLGFIFVVLARNQLFTENTLEPIIPLLNKPSWDMLKSMLSLWVVVLIGNMIGACILGLILALTPVVDKSLQDVLTTVAAQGTSAGFAATAYKAIFAGWLIALMAWLIGSTRSTGTQILFVFLTTAPISALAFPHSIAGSVEAFYRIFARTASWSDMIGNFIVPALIGNIIGGFTFVALLNHGQVAAERKAEESSENDEEKEPARRRGIQYT